MKVFSFGLLLIAVAGVHATPPPSEWERLAESLGEKLLTNIRPPGAPCHQASYDASACALVATHWTNATWRSSQIGAMQDTLWEQLNGHWCSVAVDAAGNPTNSTDPISSPCSQGNVPRFGVNASTPEDVRKAVQFADKFSIPLIVKNTGHDYLSRSSEPDRLLIWTHHMKNISYGSTTICGTEHPDTLTVAAGVQWGEAYHELAQHQRVVPGGINPNVGASGGQMMGGGHSPLANAYGLTPDSVIQLKVITLDGVFRTVNQCTNQDLFFALRGGGGGTYAIVTSTTYKTYADAPTAMTTFIYRDIRNDTQAAFEKALDIFANYSAPLAELGWSGYFTGGGNIGIPGLTGAATGLTGLFFLPLTNTTFQEASDTWTPILEQFNNTDGLAYLGAGVALLSSAQDYLSGTAVPAPGGKPIALGSRLVPKALLQDPTTRPKLTKLMASMRNDSSGTFAGATLVAGGAPSRPRDGDNGVLPAWRRAIWLFIVSRGLPTDGSDAVIEQNFEEITRILEPLRQETPGSGTYMNEADARAPAWREDFFGENYDKLLAIKNKWDPKGLLHCNRCVGSDD